jgi:hypothetical protein
MLGAMPRLLACVPLLPLLLWTSCPDRGGSRAAPSPKGPVAQRTAAAPRAPFDLGPLLPALRPGMAEQIRRQLHLGSLDELTFYDLDLALDGASEELAGRLVVHYLNRSGKALSALPLLLHPNAPLELGAAGTPGQLHITSARALVGPSVSLRPVRPTVVELALGAALQPGERLSVEVRYTGKLRRLPADSNDLLGQALASLGTSGTGAAASDYGLLASGDGLITLASAYPMVAPFEHGSFDLSRPSRFGDLAYGELAHYRVRVVLPPGLSMVSNLLDLPGPTRTPGGQLVYTALGAGNRDFAMVAGPDLATTEQTVDGIRMRSVHRRADGEAGRRALETAARALRLYQWRFGPYPYRELDVAEATLVGGAGGVEFPGMVLIAGMLYRRPSESSAPLAHLLRLVGGLSSLLQGLSGETPKSQQGELPNGLRGMDGLARDMLFFVVAHEIAHQYFAGLVGTDCRRDAGVDEPLAQFAAGEVAREARGERAGTALEDSQVKLNYGIYRLLGGTDRPVAQPVRAFGSPLAYAAIVYGKAPYFYRELRRKLGSVAFDRALRAATDAHRFQVVTLEEWLRSLDRAAGGKASALARRWFYERHGDEDLGVDESGERVMASLLGKDAVEQLRQGLGALGLQPRDLFRMLMGNMLRGEDEGGSGHDEDPLDMLKQLERLAH